MTTETELELSEFELLDYGGTLQTVTAWHLASASSHRPGKQRWIDIDIYQTEDNEYVVHTVGQSIIPGEVPKARVRRTYSAFEVIEFLTVTDRKVGDTYIPRDASRALAQAASFDDELRDAYINRAA